RFLQRSNCTINITINTTTILETTVKINFVQHLLMRPQWLLRTLDGERVMEDRFCPALRLQFQRAWLQQLRGVLLFPLHYHSHHMTHGPANGVPSTSSPPSASAAAFPPPLPLPLALQTPQFSTHHSRDSSSTTATTPTTVTGSWRSVKVTLHQQQGANSTLRMIHEKLVAAWDYMQQQQQQQMGSVEFNYITTPPPTMQKAPRAAAM
ncbi:hypothetical protein BGW38_009991, partial [Lunasporangiospora selenospora]